MTFKETLTTMEMASDGLSDVFEVSLDVVNLMTRAMAAVEVIGTLKGTAKKVAVFEMIRGVVDNFDEIESTLSKLVDVIKNTYKKIKAFIVEVFN